MPWFPEARRAGAEAEERRRPISFYDGILRTSVDELLTSWARSPAINDPLDGHVDGPDALRAWVADKRAWLERHGADVRPVAVVTTPQRTVEEVSLDLTVDGARRELPVAVVADRTPESRLLAIRVYHSLWPLTGGHRVRAPLLAEDSSIQLDGAVAAYQAALAAGDVEAVLDSYDDDARVREPSGGGYVYSGKDQLRRIYGLQFANGGGIPLEHCTATDDGTACAVEYNCVRWGVSEIPPQAGVAVYVRGRTGKLAHARIYDDVEPPAVSDSSEH